MSRKLDFSFDRRVSDQYNTQRAHPPEVSQQIGHAIADVVGQGNDVLELGIGTGRIALPVMAAGCNVTGVDLSAEMLGALVKDPRVAEAPGTLQAIRGDIGKLPFKANVFDAMTAVHVLHLVSDWKAALSGAARSLRGQAHMLLGRDWIDPECMAGELQSHFRQTVMDIMGPQLKAPTGGMEIVQAIQALGGKPIHAGPGDLVAAEWQTENRPAEILNAIRTRTYAESWVLTDELLVEVADRVEAFAAERYSDLDALQQTRRRFLISVFQGEFSA